MNKLLLASASPRRHELLTLLGIPFETYSADIDESIPSHMTPEEAVQELAFQKANVALQKFNDKVVIGCDTIVVYNEQILGKPKDKNDAREMLTQLSNHTHEVYTGVCILSKTKKILFSEKTDVTFWELTQQEILAYVDSKEPFDKAGSYGIQGKAALFVKGIQGDYYNVVGLPVSRLARELAQFASS